jgi:beta-hydroxyacyl-ACP dehydratase FabZ
MDARIVRRAPFGDEKMILDSIAIQKLLPHRYPFLMVDGIAEMERRKRIVGVKNVSINEGYFQGHFPGQPIMPGVLIIESMAQTGGVLLLMEFPDREKKLIYFAALDSARFRKPVVPGDQLIMEITVIQQRANTVKVRGEAKVDGVRVAEAELLSVMAERPK